MMLKLMGCLFTALNSFTLLASEVSLTLVGGPTVLIELEGFRILTDPTFDTAPKNYVRHITLTKTLSPSLSADQIGEIDLTLLSHDQHADNLDEEGRVVLKKSKQVFTTMAASKRLGSFATGLKPWESRILKTTKGKEYVVMAVPARHGPEGIEPIAGEVVGFVVSDKKSGEDLIYATGDTVYYEELKNISKRFKPKLILAFAGAAQPLGAKNRFTMNAKEVVELSLAFPSSLIVPIHIDSWEHFREGKSELEKVFKESQREEKIFFLNQGKKHAM